MTAVSKYRSDKTLQSYKLPKIGLKYKGLLIITYLNQILKLSFYLNHYPSHFRNYILIVLGKPKETIFLPNFNG